MDIIELLDSFSAQFAFIKFHPLCKDELSTIMNRSGHHDELLSCLLSRLQMLEQCGIENLVGTHSFEKLKSKDAKGLYSIRLKTSSYNVRVLLAKSGHELLLLAFEEKSGKRVSEYARFLEPAQKRRAEMLGGKSK